MLRNQDSRQGTRHVNDMLFHAAPDPAGDRVVENCVVRKNASIGDPIAVIHCVTIAGERVVDLQAIRHLLYGKGRITVP